MTTTAWLDNPIFVKHLRARLRRQQIFPPLIVVLVLSAFIVWFGLPIAHPDAYPGQVEASWSGALTMLICLQAFILCLIGTSQVASSVAQARESGMMDFHRISPQTPAALVWGFLLGGPIREYLLFACTLPLFYALLLAQPVSSPQWGQMGGASLSALELALVPVGLIMSSLLYHVFALLTALNIARAQLRSAGAIALILVILSGLAWITPMLNHFTVIPTLVGAMGASRNAFQFQILFFGVPVHPFVLAVVHQLPMFGFLWLAAVRKMRHEEGMLFSKGMAMLFAVMMALLALGDTAILKSNDGSTNITGPVIVLYILLLTSIIIIGITTPKTGYLLKGIRHARKDGLPRQPWWHDAAPIGPLVLFLAALLCLSGAVAMLFVQPGNTEVTISSFLLASLIGAGTILFFGFGLQYFMLTYRKHGVNYFAVCLFLFWVVPLLIAMVVGITGGSGNTVPYCLSLSSFAGLGLSFDPSDGLGYGALSAGITTFLVIIFGLLYWQCIRSLDNFAVYPTTPRPVPPLPTSVG